MIDCSASTAESLMDFILMQHSLESLNMCLKFNNADELFSIFLRLLKSLRPTTKELVLESIESQLPNEQISLRPSAIDRSYF